VKSPSPSQPNVPRWPALRPASDHATLLLWGRDHLADQAARIIKVDVPQGEWTWVAVTSPGLLAGAIQRRTESTQSPCKTYLERPELDPQRGAKYPYPFATCKRPHAPWRPLQLVS
jgi:hypothetical protein